MSKKSRRKSNLIFAVEIIFLVFFLVGVGVFIYPDVSDLMVRAENAGGIEGYDLQVSKLSRGELDEMLRKAREYNETLTPSYHDVFGADEQTDAEASDTDAEYYDLLNVDGIMGYIEIPCIDVKLNIYHGLGDDILVHGVGHVEGTSLPIGGTDTHAALAAHRGLPSAKMFTDLNKVEVGDTFTITVLNRKLTYRVDNIQIVVPDDDSPLRIQQGRDLVTLITCTPYAVNTHRLLVTGVRVDDGTGDTDVQSEVRIKLIVGIAALVIFVPFMISVMVRERKALAAAEKRRPKSDHGSASQPVSDDRQSPDGEPPADDRFSEPQPLS